MKLWYNWKKYYLSKRRVKRYYIRNYGIRNERKYRNIDCKARSVHRAMPAVEGRIFRNSIFRRIGWDETIVLFL